MSMLSWLEVRAAFERTVVKMPLNQSTHTSTSDLGETTTSHASSVFHAFRFPARVRMDQAGVTQLLEQALADYFAPGLEVATWENQIHGAEKALEQRCRVPLNGEAGVQACVDGVFLQPVNAITLDAEATRNRTQQLEFGTARYLVVNSLRPSSNASANLVPDFLGKLGMWRDPHDQLGDSNLLTGEAKPPAVLGSCVYPFAQALSFDGLKLNKDSSIHDPEARLGGRSSTPYKILYQVLAQMIQYRVKIGFLTDGDLWYIFIADVTASSPKDDCVRVAQFAPRPMSADQSPLFCGSPWATLLACLALADPNGLPIRSADDPLSTAYPVTRQSGPYRAQPDGPGPVTRAQARQANTLPGGTGQSDAANAQQQLLSIASGLEYRMPSIAVPTLDVRISSGSSNSSDGSSVSKSDAKSTGSDDGPSGPAARSSQLESMSTRPLRPLPITVEQRDEVDGGDYARGLGAAIYGPLQISGFAGTDGLGFGSGRDQIWHESRDVGGLSVLGGEAAGATGSGAGLRIGPLLGRGSTWEAYDSYINSQRVVVKVSVPGAASHFITADSIDGHDIISRAVHHEIALYQGPLCALQGTVVPRLLGFFTGSFTASEGAVSHTAWIAILEYAGVRSSTGKIPASLKPTVLALYDKLHSAGVLHGDPSDRHILVRVGSAQIASSGAGIETRLIDFDRAGLRDSGEYDAPGAWDQAVEAENLAIRQVLEQETCL